MEEEILNFLERSRREHYSCEDGYYSCPKDYDINGECDCIADEYNKELDEIIAKFKILENLK